MSKRASAAEEAGMITAYRRGASMADAAIRYGYTEKTCANVLRRHGIQPRRVGEPRNLSPDEERDAVHRYEAGETLTAVGKVYGMSASSILRTLRRREGRVRHNKRYHFDEAFFSRIDTDAKAYALGLISADGSVRQNPVRLCLHLKTPDRALLERVAAAMSYAGLIRDREYARSNGPRAGQAYERSELLICSRRIVDDLTRLGVHENKTFTLRPWGGPAELMPAYWRGFIDGDGTWRRTETGHECVLNGTLPVIQAFCTFVRGLSGDWKLPYQHGRIWRACFRRRATLRMLAESLYQTSTISLDRKRVVAEAAGRVFEGP